MLTLLVGILPPGAQGGANLPAASAGTSDRGRAGEPPGPPADAPQFAAHQLLVKLTKGSRLLVQEGRPDATGIASLDAIHRAHGVKRFERLARPGAGSPIDAELFGWYVVTLDGPPGTSRGRLDAAGRLSVADPQAARLARLIASYRSDPHVEAVDLNYVVTIDLAPNDPYYWSTGTWGQSYPDLWGLRKLNAEAAWDQTTGSASIIVADIDTGVDRNHPDLAPNIWVNPREIPGNGIDDDGNGYVDDVYGWDWVNNDNDPMDDNGHGTHTVGTIAGVGNNGQGVVGVNWTSKVMALKFLDSSGSGYLANGIKALQYAADMGARVASNSWGCQCQSPALDDGVQYARDRGVVVVVAAGNSNLDALDFSPASADGAITVAASDPNDARASFSNWGEKIDVAAPGVDILSTRSSQDTLCAPRGYVVNTIYCRLSGTSMATPHVAGLAALLLARNPALGPEEVRQLLRRGAVDLGAAGKDPSFGYGRIDAGGSMTLAATKPLAPIITSPRSRTTVSGTALQILGGIAGPNFASYKLEVGAGRSPTTWTTLVTSTTQVTNGVLATVDTTRLAEGPNIFRLTATDTSGRTYQFQVNDVQVDNFDAEIALPQLLVARGTIDVIGSAGTKNGLAFGSYKLEWGAGTAPTTWSTAGISLTNSGTQPVANGLLGRWDTTGLAAGQSYTLRLSVSGATGVTAQIAVTLTLDQDLVPGWPKLLTFRSPLLSLPATVPALADLDGDGRKEAILVEPGGTIRVFRKDGSAYPGFPVSAGTGWYLNVPPNIADVDGDGKKEILISATDGAWTRKLLIFRSDGSLYPGWPAPQVSDGSGGDDTPAVADLDGDGRKELVFADMSGKVHATHLDGTELAGFPRQVFPSTASTLRPSITVADLDVDGRPEIVVPLQNAVYVLDAAGNVVPGWPVQNPSYNGQALAFASAAAVGDLDGDGRLEVFVLATTPYCGGCTAYVYRWTKDGVLPASWPRATGLLMYNNVLGVAPTVADVDADGKDEAVVATDRVYIHGTTALEASGGTGAITPALGDVDGDGRIEAASAYDRAITVVDARGATLWSRSFSSVAGYAFTIPPVLADMDGNGRLELVAILSPFSSTSTTAYAFLWELPQVGGTGPATEWPLFGHDPARSGRLARGSAPGATATPTPAPSLTPMATPTATGTPAATTTPTATSTPPAAPTATGTPVATATATSTPVATPTTTSTPAPAGTMHVADLAATSTKLQKGLWSATVTITIFDSANRAVTGATVYGTFTQDTWSKAVSCTTDASGTCTVNSGVFPSTTPRSVFTVTSVTHPVLKYDPRSNGDLNGDSNGTTIIVSK
jgi:subtilisin family serine protease